MDFYSMPGFRLRHTSTIYAYAFIRRSCQAKLEKLRHTSTIHHSLFTIHDSRFTLHASPLTPPSTIPRSPPVPPTRDSTPDGLQCYSVRQGSHHSIQHSDARV